MKEERKRKGEAVLVDGSKRGERLVVSCW